MGESQARAPAGPLAGLPVLEVGHFVAAPFASRLLAGYGSEVIKIEPPGAGDPLRTLADPEDGPSLWWSSLGRNKKSVTIDLRKPRGQELFHDLAAMSGAVVETPPGPAIGLQTGQAAGDPARALRGQAHSAGRA